MAKPFVIGITGGSASGKTLFLNKLLDRFQKEEVCLISQDNYYKPKSEIPVDENGVHNYDLPECIDWLTYASHIESLLAGKEVKHKEYTFNNPDAPDTFKVYKPAKVIVVEGLFVFYDEQVSKFLDLKLFVDAKEKVKIKRRILRDSIERGYNEDDVRYRWKHHVQPTYKKYIKPTKKSSDIVINNNDHFENALEVVAAYLERRVSQK